MSTATIESAKIPRCDAAANLKPKEHGAYAILAIPIVTAILVTGPTVVGLCVAVASLAGFLAHEPLLVALGHRGARYKLRKALDHNRIWCPSIRECRGRPKEWAFRGRHRVSDRHRSREVARSWLGFLFGTFGPSFDPRGDDCAEFCLGSTTYRYRLVYFPCITTEILVLCITFSQKSLLATLFDTSISMEFKFIRCGYPNFSRWGSNE